MSLVVILLLSWLPVLEAHRLDECLQAARIEVGRSGLVLELDVTPGLETLPGILPLIDVDGDGSISPTEGEGYADLVCQSLTLQLNGRTLGLRMEVASMPLIADLKAGNGLIRFKLAAEFRPLRSGSHTLHFENRHLTGVSVYLVNALVPRDSSVQVREQWRDAIQRKFQLKFTVSRSREHKGKVGGVSRR